MESLTEAQRAAITTAVNAGRRVKHTAANRSVLATGPRRYIVLLQADGTPTPSGEFYFELTHERLPDRKFDYSQEPIRNGDSEFAKDRQNRLIRLRTLLPSEKYNYTQAGRLFFSRRQVEAVVHIPVLINGRRANGTTYTKADMLPYARVGMARLVADARLTPSARDRAIKNMALNSLTLRREGGRRVLHEFSNEVYYYDPDRQWRISTLTTTPDGHDPNADPHVHAALNQRMGHLAGCASHIARPELVLEEAWETRESKDCVPYQLAALLGLKLEDVCDEFDRLVGEAWRGVGVLPSEVKAYCVEHRLGYHCLVGKRLAESYLPEDRRGTVAFSTFDGHCYMYSDHRWLAKRTPVAAPQGVQTALQGEARSCTPPFAEWEPWGGPRPGNFHHEDLDAVRRELLNLGRNPAVTLRSLAEASKLVYTCTPRADGSSGQCVVRQTPPHAEKIARWTAGLGVEWRGERLPAITERVFKTLLEARRRTPGEKEKLEILRRQRDRCAECFEPFDGDEEFDHAQPLRTCVKGQAQRFRALCGTCHAEATASEGGHRTIESRFSPKAWTAYVKSPRPPPIAFNPHAEDGRGTMFECDVRRCRQNALKFAAHDAPVFCALDSVVPAQPGVLADLSFVFRVLDSRLSALKRLPYVGPGWYHRVAVEFLLDHQKISWDCVSRSFRATGHVPKECVTAPLEAMGTAWEDEDMEKLSVNSMIGLWQVDPTERYHVISSHHGADGDGAWLRQTFPYGDREIIDSIGLTRIVSNASMRPWHDMIMHTEAVRVAQMLWLVECAGVPARQVCSVKTDALIFTCPRKRKAAVLEVGDVRVCDLGGRAAQARDAPVFVFRLREHTSEHPVRPLAGDHLEPSIRATEPAMNWWRELETQAAWDHALAGGSLLCVGSPGVGKTTWARALVAELRKTKRVDVVAKCHVSVQNFGESAVTLDRWVRRTVRKGVCPCEVLVVEEISQVSCYLWSDIAAAALKGLQVVLLGDFWQLDPVKDLWLGSPPPGLEHSDLLHGLAGGAVVRLTENHRSDPPLFAFYTGLRGRDLGDALAEARGLFPCGAVARYTLCISHRMRVAVNRKENLRAKPEGAVLYKATRGRKGANNSQDMFLWEGQELVGAGGRVPKGTFVTVEAVDEEHVTASGVKLTRTAAVKSLRLCSAITYAACQGLTLQGSVLLEETGSQAFTIRHLYVGSSRCTAAGLLQVR